MTFASRVEAVQSAPLTACGIDVLQVNLGYRCNMSCRHCHIDATPTRVESMSQETVLQVLDVLRHNEIGTVDITGGAPEMHEQLRPLVQGAARLNRAVWVRSNLTIFFEPGQEGLDRFYAEHGVTVIASLPCYTEPNVDGFRGPGTYLKSIEAIRRLNALGYGCGDPRLQLHLVYNPAGPSLAPPQQKLEADYKRELMQREGLRFDHLYTFTNMPIGRFGRMLQQAGELETYRARLAEAFNPCALQGVMCRRLVSVGWDGTLYDCDFNQALGLQMHSVGSRHISQFDYEALAGRRIAVDDHCLACTAGQGSSCCGSLT